MKFLHPWIAAQKTFLSRFENEAKAMSRLLHPHCVSVIDFGVEGSPYLVMDFVTGRTLRDLMLEGRLPAARAMRLAQQLLAGLAHAHEQGIVHRDLKPENLILSEEAGLKEHLRILDFGLAKLRDGPQMTAGMAVGTPSYMSPEQSGAEGAIDARTDLYTVGIVLFEMFAGRKPFQSENVGEVILMQRETPPPKLRSVARRRALLGGAGGAARQGDVQAARGSLPVGGRAGRGAGGDAGREAAGQEIGIGRRRRRPRPTREGRRRRPTRRTARRTRTRRRAGEAGAGRDGAPGREDDDRHRLGGAAAAGGDAAAARRQPVRQFRLAWIGALFVVVALLALLIGRGLRHGGGDATATAARPSTAAATAAAGRAAPRPAGAGAPSGDSPQLEQARQMVARGEIDPAIALLNQLRAQQPDNADAPYLLAMVDFDNRRWPDGLAAAQMAVRKNPALKADPDLIKGAIRSLVSDRGYDRSQAFLRSLGQPATPFIKEAAARDPSPKVRERAAELLGGSGRGWGSRPSSRRQHVPPLDSPSFRSLCEPAPERVVRRPTVRERSA